MYANVNIGPLPIFSGTDGPVDWFEPLPGERMRIRIGSEATDGRLTLLENVVAAGASAPSHLHFDADELFIVLEGRLRLTSGKLNLEAGPGAAVYVPHGAAHAFVNEGSTDARLLSVFVPGGMEAMFKEAVGIRPEDIAAMARRHGTEVRAPGGVD